MMGKSWADHCSSDEESLDDTGYIADNLQNQKLDDAPPPEAVETQPQEEEQQQQEEEQQPAEAAAPPERVYDFPDKPPFTAFIGGLAYSVKEGEDLKHAVADLAQERLGAQINVIGGRIGVDRRDGRHRGFGYVEVETLDELKLLMNLNDGQSMIAGRKIQLDTANQGPNHGGHNNRRNSDRRHSDNRQSSDGGFGDIDGSKFRGGIRNSRRSSGTSGDQPAAQRPSLKLAPRSKPREGEEKKGASADIFGGATARDEQAWEKRRMSAKAEGDNKKDGGHQQDRRGSGRGRGNQQDRRGSGRGRGGGGGRGRGDNNNQSNRRDSKAKRNSSKQQSPEEKAAAAAAAASVQKSPEPAPTPAPAPKKEPTNKFALLMDSDSD